jgi:large subunit ribosomal protein L3
MAGHMGDKMRTIQNLEIVKSDIENNLIFIKGSIPGSKNSFVLIQKNTKKINRNSSVDKARKIQTSGVDDNIKRKNDTSLKNEKSKDVKKNEKVKK